MKAKLRAPLVPLEVLVLVLLLLFVANPFGGVYVYHWDSNGGVIVTSPAGCVGLEVYGNPGFFGGTDPGACDG